MPNKLSQFWQELKRRNVVRVITVYAGAAFVIIELINNITEPLHLPEWTPTFVIVLLAIGFPIVTIFSWIYDVHPEGGMVKTEPADKIKPEDVPKSSNSWKIASYISFVVIVGLIVLNVIPRSGKKEIRDKSIAVLPFKNDSPDEEKMYFINGTMDAILDNLCKIEDLRVVSRNSVEQYRNNPKPTPVVAEEMDVSYVLEGSGQKIGNRVLLIVQLIDGVTDHHLWSKQYDREIVKVEDLIDIQKEIAQLVAGEIDAIITPQEQELIEKIPTTSLTAFDFYQRGREEYWRYWSDNNNDEALHRAEELYNEALRYDSTYALAICGLASVYWDRNYWKEYYTESFMDSSMLLIDKALSFDPQLSGAYAFRGSYNYIIGNFDAANEAYNKALIINPNEWTVYRELGKIYSDNDIVKSIQNFQKAISLNKEPQILPDLLRRLSVVYYNGGFFEKGHTYELEALKLDKDSVKFFNTLYFMESTNFKYEESLVYLKRALALDSSNIKTLEYLGDIYAIIGNKEEALHYKMKYLERLKVEEVLRINDMHRVAYIYWINGLEEEADHYFDLQMKYCEKDISLQRPSATRKYSYYDLAGIYAFRGDSKQAMGNLSIFNQRKVMPYYMTFFINWDPLFDNIRDEPEFQQIVRDVEAKYQAEHERVRQWLEENDML